MRCGFRNPAQGASYNWTEPAAFVKVRLNGGTTFKGTIVAVKGDTFTVLMRTRIPVPARAVRFDEVSAVERAHEGRSPGSKVLIGAGAVAGGVLLIGLAVLAAAYD